MLAAVQAGVTQPQAAETSSLRKVPHSVYHENREGEAVPGVPLGKAEQWHGRRLPSVRHFFLQNIVVHSALLQLEMHARLKKVVARL
jgi:hypothetical protein